MDDEDKFIEDLITLGAIEINSITSEGEPLYKITPRLKEIWPELYSQHMSVVNQSIMNLWQKGYLEIDLLAEVPNVSLSIKTIKKESFDDLNPEELSHLTQIVEILSN